MHYMYVYMYHMQMRQTMTAAMFVDDFVIVVSLAALTWIDFHFGGKSA